MKLLIPASCEAPIDFSQFDFGLRLLHSKGFDLHVVLAGSNADEFLRNVRGIELAELIFDANGESPSLATQIRSGLKAVKDFCLISPPHMLLKDDFVSSCKKLTHHYWLGGQGEYFHGLKMSDKAWPFMITRSGITFLQENLDINDLSDERLCIYQVNQDACQTTGHLASGSLTSHRID